MVILVLNCGSSSIKYKVFDLENGSEVMAKGLVERIGISDSILSHKPLGKEPHKIITNIPDHTIGINLVIDALTHKEYGVINDVRDIAAVGHRVAHGGENFTRSVLIDSKVKKDIEMCCELAPLHNPANLKGILSVEKLVPGVPQVAVFDTSFHQTIPDYAYMYALPYEYYEKYRVRKYGFHGTSHKFVALKAAGMLKKDINDLKIITCHLGNGASVAAIDRGKSIDTSMGFTPVDGLIMGTRSGEVDPGVLIYIAGKEHFNVQNVSDMINKESGVLGITGLSSDMRDLEMAANDGNERAILALNMYAYKVKKFIGSYVAALNGFDVLVFTGGVGENDFNLRKMICSDMEYLGLEFDMEVNHNKKGKDLIISKPSSKVAVMTLATDEEYVIASDTKDITSAK